MPVLASLAGRALASLAGRALPSRVVGSLSVVNQGLGSAVRGDLGVERGVALGVTRFGRRVEGVMGKGAAQLGD